MPRKAIFLAFATSATAVCCAVGQDLMARTRAYVEKARLVYPKDADNTISAVSEYVGELSSNVVASSDANDACPVRWMDVPGIRNLRDIGGWNGLVTGMVYRGSCIATNVVGGFTNPLRFKTEIDLREQSEILVGEVRCAPNYINCPLKSYTNMFDQALGKSYAKVLRIFGNRSNYPIYIHCAGGADRTASVLFLLEGLCGVSRTDVEIDYELTSLSGSFGLRSRTDSSYKPFRPWMIEMLKRPGEGWRDKITNFVKEELGLMTEEIAAIRKNLIKPSDVEVAAVYYPHWHRYPKGDEWFGERYDWNEGEWVFVKDAKAKFPGHHQPLVPTAGYLKGDNPDDVEKEIALAANAGIDVFIYDYYYYDGHVTQEEALEKGFLNARNRNMIKFALMWCYHERNDQFRPRMGDERRRLMSLAHRPEELLGLIDLSIKRYFCRPEYWRKDGKIFFSIYNAGYFRNKLGDSAAKATLAEVRRRVRNSGLGELHINGQLIDPAQADSFMELGFDSFTDYNIGPYFDWGHYAGIYASGVREQDYSVIEALTRERWIACSSCKMPYLYSVTTGWDRTPRCRQDEPYPWKGVKDEYPYEITVTNNTPERFEVLLSDAKERAERDLRKPGVVYINAWNEYTEGEWLVPDNFYEDGYLRAIANVFGRKPASEYTFVDAWTKRIFSIPSATFENVAYGNDDPKQGIDVWLPETKGVRTPMIVYFHGGGWSGGMRVDRIIGNSIRRILGANIAVAAVGYRYLDDQPRATPPVNIPLADCEAALRLIMDRAAGWNVDIGRIALAGGSAGAATALYLGLKDNNLYGIRAVAAINPQTSLDPMEMRKWIPNINYGFHAFGYADFDSWLRHRDECVADIENISAAALARRIDVCSAPAIFILCKWHPEDGVLPQDPAHAGEFGLEFKRVCDENGIPCEVNFGDNDFYGAIFDRLINFEQEKHKKERHHEEQDS